MGKDNQEMNGQVLKIEELSDEVLKQLESQGIDVKKLKEMGEIDFENIITQKQFKESMEEAKKEMLLEFYQEHSKGEDQESAEDVQAQFKTLKKAFDAVSMNDMTMTRELSLNSTSDGTVIPEEFTNTVLERADQYGLMRRYATGITMSSNKLDMHKITGEPGVVWVGENGTIKKGKPSFGRIALIPAKLALIIPWSTEFEEDEAISIFPIIQRILARQVAKAEDDMMLMGDGTVFTGLFNHPDVNIQSLPTGKTAFGDITADDLLTMTDNILDNEEASSMYVLHRTIYNRVKLLKDGNSAYVFPTTSDRIWQYNKATSSLLPSYSESAADKKFVLFGDLSNVYYGERRQLTMSMADQASLKFEDGSETNLFEQDMRALKITERIAISVAVPEQFTILKTAAS